MNASDRAAHLPREIVTARLRMRVPRPDDAELVFSRWTSDPEVARYSSWRAHETHEDTAAWLTSSVDAWRTGGGHLPWLLELREGEPGPVGAAGLTREGHRVSVGYALSRAYWGRGLATEAAAALVELAAGLDGVQRVWAYCDVDNPASARVLEKVGMVREATLQRWAMHPNLADTPRDVLVYVLPRR